MRKVRRIDQLDPSGFPDPDARDRKEAAQVKTEYRYISGDSHFEVAPDNSRHRVSAEYRHLAPCIVWMLDGEGGWVG